MASTAAYALGAERRVLAIFVASFGLNVTANLLAIPVWGIEGAAAANLLTEALAFILLLALLHRRGVRLEWTAAVGKPLMAIAPSALVVVVLAGSPLAARLAAGAAVYFAGLLLLRTFDRHDYDFLRAAGGLPTSGSQAELSPFSLGRRQKP